MRQEPKIREMTEKEIEERKRELREQHAFLKRIEQAETLVSDNLETLIVVPMAIYVEKKDESTTNRYSG